MRIWGFLAICFPPLYFGRPLHGLDLVLLILVRVIHALMGASGGVIFLFALYPSGRNVYSNSPCQPDVRMMRSVPSTGLQLYSLDLSGLFLSTPI